MEEKLLDSKVSGSAGGTALGCDPSTVLSIAVFLCTDTTEGKLSQGCTELQTALHTSLRTWKESVKIRQVFLFPRLPRYDAETQQTQKLHSERA